MNKKTKFVKTLDNWFPNFPDEKVQVSLHFDSENQFRVSVWGNDDHGMEKVFESIEAALGVYNQLNKISHSKLIEMGFVTA